MNHNPLTAPLRYPALKQTTDPQTIEEGLGFHIRGTQMGETLRSLVKASRSESLFYFCNRVLLRTSVNLKEEENPSWVLGKPLIMNDIRNMVVPSINDAIAVLEQEIAFLYPELARRVM